MKKNVLLIEDEEDIRSTLQMILEFDGLSVVTAANGLEGIEVLAKGLKPDVVLLDLMMPVMTGTKFLELKLADQNLASIPVVVFSAMSKVNQVPRGAVALLSKPVDLEDLLRTVRTYVAGPTADESSALPMSTM